MKRLFDFILPSKGRGVTREHIILYLFITIGYLVHWVHNDLEYHPGRFTTSIANNIWQLIYIMGANLLFFEVCLPFITSRKTYRVPVIILSVCVYLILFTSGLFLWRELGRWLELYQPLTTYTSTTKAYSDSVRFSPGPFLVFAVFKLFFDYTRLRYERQQAQLEKKQAELVFLKSQINPHFLFNTLNNIYSLSQYKPQLVSESVLRLSKLLRYILYEANDEWSTIGKEIKIMNDYIDLEKLRYSESVVIGFNHDVDDMTAQIPPLLLLPLVENAFKHGVSLSRGKRSATITCTLKQHELNFIVENSIPQPDLVSEEAKQQDHIGLSNLRRRLMLLYTDYSFSVDENVSTFKVHLKINLLKNA
jgi:two-component system, LytTR family, sensor kinase